MKKKRRVPNPIIAIQRERCRRFLEYRRGDGGHLSYLGYIIPKDEALLDAFLYFRDEWEGRDIGLPMIVLVDISGTDIRYATPDEIHQCLSSRLLRREPGKGEREYKL